MSKVSKLGVISGPYFPVFGLNTGKYRREVTPYLDTFHPVHIIGKIRNLPKSTKVYLSQVIAQLKILLVLLSTNAVSERSASTLRTIKKLAANVNDTDKI